MSISKICKACLFCCIAYLNINYNVTNVAAHDIIHINDVNKANYIISEHSYIYNNIVVNNNTFQNRVVLYNNDVILNITKDNVSIYRCDKDTAFDSNEVKAEFSNMQRERVNALKQSLDKDFITYIKEDIKTIFGNNYKLYFDYINMDYEGQQIDEDKYKEYFNGTFEELMQVNGSQLITKINYDLQFMKNMWFFNSGNKHFVVTDNNNTYYFDIDNNKILIYSRNKKSWNKSNEDIKELMKKVKERWNKEQTEIHKVFGNDYRIYYDEVGSVNDPNSDYYDNLNVDNIDING